MTYADIEVELLALRADVSGIQQEVREIKARVGSLEHSTAARWADVAQLRARHDRLQARVERIERRLPAGGGCVAESHTS